MVGKWAKVLLSSILAVTLAACGKPVPSEQTASKENSPDSGNQKVLVYTTVYPLYYVAERIAGKHAEVRNIVPAGVEPHDFEPTAQDVIAMSKADVFIYNGSGFEQWVEKAIEGFDNHQMVVVNATEGLELIHVEEEHDHGETEEHSHGPTDPHVWLDPTLLKAQAEKVKQAMVQVDQANQAEYEQKYQELAADLDNLDREFAEMVKQAVRKDFVVAHSAFGYLAKRYGLEQVSISGISPSDEPSPSELQELVEHVKADNIKYVLFETLASPKVAEVIARETGAKTATLNPLEGLTEEEIQAGKDYLTVMRENMETLRKVLSE